MTKEELAELKRTFVAVYEAPVVYRLLQHIEELGDEIRSLREQVKNTKETQEHDIG